MATVKVCDKCGEHQGVFSKLVLSYDQQHVRGSDEWIERTKRTFDLCESCAMSIALQIDEFADAVVMDDPEEE